MKRQGRRVPAEEVPRLLLSRAPPCLRYELGARLTGRRRLGKWPGGGRNEGALAIRRAGTRGLSSCAAELELGTSALPVFSFLPLIGRQ